LIRSKVTGGSSTGGLIGYGYKTNVLNIYTINSEIRGSKRSIVSNKDSSTNIGGLIGLQVEGNIYNSYFSGSVSGKENIGGLVGRREGGEILDSYSLGIINGSGDSVGGLVGVSYSGNIYNSYSVSEVSGNSYIGGLVGKTFSSTTVYNSYSVAKIAGNSIFGGLVGSENWRKTPKVFNSYWYGLSDNELDCYFGGNRGCAKINSEEYFKGINLTSKAPFFIPRNINWDFEKIWQENINEYPSLRSPIDQIEISRNFKIGGIYIAGANTLIKNSKMDWRDYGGVWERNDAEYEYYGSWEISNFGGISGFGDYPAIFIEGDVLLNWNSNYLNTLLSNLSIGPNALIFIGARSSSYDTSKIIFDKIILSNGSKIYSYGGDLNSYGQDLNNHLVVLDNLFCKENGVCEIKSRSDYVPGGSLIWVLTETVWNSLPPGTIIDILGGEFSIFSKLEGEKAYIQFKDPHLSSYLNPRPIKETITLTATSSSLSVSVDVESQMGLDVLTVFGNEMIYRDPTPPSPARNIKYKNSNGDILILPSSVIFDSDPRFDPLEFHVKGFEFCLENKHCSRGRSCSNYKCMYL
jgi:hypothetical protein